MNLQQYGKPRCQKKTDEKRRGAPRKILPGEQGQKTAEGDKANQSSRKEDLQEAVMHRVRGPQVHQVKDRDTDQQGAAALGPEVQSLNYERLTLGE